MKILLDKSSQSSDEESEGFEQVDEVLGLDIESDEEDGDDIQTHEVCIITIILTCVSNFCMHAFNQVLSGFSGRFIKQ